MKKFILLLMILLTGCAGSRTVMKLPKLDSEAVLTKVNIWRPHKCYRDSKHFLVQVDGITALQMGPGIHTTLVLNPGTHRLTVVAPTMLHGLSTQTVEIDCPSRERSFKLTWQGLTEVPGDDKEMWKFVQRYPYIEPVYDRF